MPNGTSLLLSKPFIRFGRLSLKEMFTKISSCELRENRWSERHTLFYGARAKQISFPTFRNLLSVWVKFGTRDPHKKLSSNCEFVENLPVEILVECKRTVIIMPSVLRQVHILFQSEFSTQCELVFPLPISSTLSFL